MATSTTPENGSSTRRRKDPPEKKIGPFPNGVGACIWTNQVTTEQGPRTFRSITINARRYFDRETNQWRDTMSYNPSDLPSLIYALQLAAKFCFEQGHAEPEELPSSDAPPLNKDEIPF